jgi:hypothetical protein
MRKNNVKSVKVSNRYRSQLPNEPVEQTCTSCKISKHVENYYMVDLVLFIRSRQCRQCLSYKSRARRLKRDTKLDTNLFSDLNKFLKYLKLRNFMATEIDIFKLIDMYDRTFPNSAMPIESDKELVFNKMLLKLIRYYKLEVEKNNI